MSRFAQRLNLLLEYCQEEDPAEEAINIIRKLDNIRHQMLELQDQLSSIKKKTIGKFATQVHQERPDLNINVDDNGCKIGQKETCINLEPDLNNQTWMIQGTPNMGGIRELLDKVFTYFEDKDLEENGQIYINGQKSNMLLLSEWMNTKKIITRRNTQ